MSVLPHTAAAPAALASGNVVKVSPDTDPPLLLALGYVCGSFLPRGKVCHP